MDDFDYIKGFADVNILQAEAIAEVIGRVLGKVFLGMIAAGMDHEDAHVVIVSAERELAKAVLSKPS